MIRISRMNITDIPELAAIEQASQVEPWSEAAFWEEVGIPHSLVLVARMIEPPPEPNAVDLRVCGAGFPACLPRIGRLESLPHNPPNHLESTALPPEPERDGAAAGYICLWIVAGEAQVLNLAVHPPYRGRGVGRALLLHGLDIAVQRGAEKAFLEVRKSNAVARKLYESVGFEKTGQRPNFYRVNKEAAVLMELRLDDQ
jgi:ribosomal-protein-alanine acetyltransferase